MADLTVRPRSRLAVVAIAAIVLAILVALAALMSGLGTRWGLWNFGTGFQILRYSAMAAIATAMKDRTTFIIAHRLATVRNADRATIRVTTTVSTVTISSRYEMSLSRTRAPEHRTRRLQRERQHR